LVLAVFGEKGAGKTLMAGQMGDSEYIRNRAGNKDKLVYFFNVEGGMRTLQGRKDIEYGDIVDWVEYEKAIDKMIAIPDPFPWGGIVIDNATELAELNMKKILKQARKTLPEWPEFRLNAAEMVVQIRKLRDLARARGIVIVFNVWEQQDTDDSGNVLKIRTDMTPKVGSRFMGAVDMGAWLEVLDDEPPSTRVLHLAGNRKVQVKPLRLPPGSGVPYDLYWRNPEDPANNPLLSLIGTLLGGEPWPKNRHLAPPGVRAGMIRRAAQTAEK
jgi:hypothetical protein